MKKIIFAVLAALGITGWANSVYWYRKAGKKTSESIDAQLERNHFAAFIVHNEEEIRRGNRYGLIPSEERTIKKAKEIYKKEYGPIL